jgi:antitoxin (DNA-binding transcriptional repressor) of toxin-antitoxin stability system
MPVPEGGKRHPRPGSGVGTPRVVEVKAGVFKDRCLQLLDQVREGEIQVVVTKHGRPVARVVAPAAGRPSAFGFMRATVLAQDDIVSPDFDSWGDLQ